MKLNIEVFYRSGKIVELDDEVTLVKDQCRLDIRKYSFSHRTINEWNNLSTNCVSDISLNYFL